MAEPHIPSSIANPPKVTGLDLRLEDQVLEVAWADGAKARFKTIVLRKHCPCAACRTEREKRSEELLPVLSSPPASEIHATGGHVVGNYALQLDWSDGHNTGIYDFRLLRALHENGVSEKA